MGKKLTEKELELIGRFVSKLKVIRKGKQISQRIVTWDTGINMGRLECARSNITITTLYTLCKYYNIPFEELFKDI